MNQHPMEIPYPTAGTQARPGSIITGSVPSFGFIAVGDLQYRAPEFLIDGLIETESLGLIFGDPGCGKSFLAVNLSLCVATGQNFHGRAVKQGPVFLIAGEGHNGLARRFAAWAKDQGEALKGVPLFQSKRAAHFLDGASAASVATAVDCLTIKYGNPVLIVIDTLARNFGAGDENNTKDMSEFISAIDDLKARYPGCTVLIIHHSGHADKTRARGAMALKGALDFEYLVEKEGERVVLTNTKMKDAEPPSDQHFTLESVDLGDGAKSAVLHRADAPERKQRPTTAQQHAMATYETAAVVQGVWEEDAFRGLHVDQWRNAFYAKHTGDNPEAKKKAFQRVRAELVRIGMMAVTDDVYLAIDAGFQIRILQQRDKRDMVGHSANCPAVEAGNAGTSGTSV